MEAKGCNKGQSNIQNNDLKYQQAIELLVSKYQELNQERLPKRSDFDDEAICFIKQKLGPWPRALEAAGLKVKTKPSAQEVSRQKRQRRKDQLRKDGNAE